MTTGRLLFKSRVLETRYGLKGKVASRYLKAGYQVSILKNHPMDILVTGNNHRFIIKIVTKRTELTDNLIKSVQEYARKMNAKGIIAIYGCLRVEKSFIEQAVSSGIELKRIRS